MLQICYNYNTNLYIFKKFFKNFHIPYISHVVYKYKSITLKKKKKQIVMIYLYHNN